MAPDEITTGELGRRMDEVRNDVRTLLSKFDDLDTKFVPRAELDERHRLIDLQYHALEAEVRANRDAIADARTEASTTLDTYKADVVTARRWTFATLSTVVLMAAALVVNVALH